MNPEIAYQLAQDRLIALRRRADTERLARSLRRSPNHPTFRRRSPRPASTGETGDSTAVWSPASAT